MKIYVQFFYMRLKFKFLQNSSVAKMFLNYKYFIGNLQFVLLIYENLIQFSSLSNAIILELKNIQSQLFFI